MSIKIRTRKYEEMFPDEVFDEIAKNPIIYLAFGGLEVHGPHNPLGIDMLPFYRIALEAAEKTGGIVHPPVYMAVPGHPPLTSAEMRKSKLNLCPPSIWHGRDLMEAWLDETLWNFNKLGFKICVLLPGHAPNFYLAHEWCGKMNGRYGDMALFVCDCSPMIAMAGFTRKESGHGAMMESAWLEALCPGMMDLKRIRKAIIRQPDVKALDARYAWDSRKAQSYNRIAVQKGRAFVDIAVEWIAQSVARQRRKTAARTAAWSCCPGHVTIYRVSRIRHFTGDLNALPYPGAAQIKKFSVREFRKSLCVISEFADLRKDKSLFIYLGFKLVCSKFMRLDLGLGYDGPVKAWVDRKVRLSDEHGACPASGPNGGDKTVIPLELSRGRHTVLFALVSNGGFASGISVRLRRHGAVGASIIKGLPLVDVAD